MFSRLLSHDLPRSKLLAAILIVMAFWRRSPRFLKQAFAANTVLMTAGFVLMGYQITGFFAS